MQKLNMDLSKKVVMETEKMDWIDSPESGVKRRPLEREFEESGRTTSIVEYKPGASFQTHMHPLGEEIFVLEGTFSDENGDYPAGTYLRNPPGSSHAPFSKDGCKIFVKLNAMSPEDNSEIRIHTRTNQWLDGHGNLKVMPLHTFGTENVALVKWPAGEKFIPHTHYGGEEILVLSGEFIDEYASYPIGTWIRSPHLSTHSPLVKEETVILVKTGHLLI